VCIRYRYVKFSEDGTCETLRSSVEPRGVVSGWEGNRGICRGVWSMEVVDEGKEGGGAVVGNRVRIVTTEDGRSFEALLSVSSTRRGYGLLFFNLEIYLRCILIFDSIM
jgi:hypothetical protein